MKTITNVSAIQDNSSEPSTVTYSNEVTTVVRQPDPTPMPATPRYYRLPCNYCGCDCNCHCNRCRKHGNRGKKKNYGCGFREINL